MLNLVAKGADKREGWDHLDVVFSCYFTCSFSVSIGMFITLGFQKEKKVMNHLQLTNWLGL